MDLFNKKALQETQEELQESYLRIHELESNVKDLEEKLVAASKMHREGIHLVLKEFETFLTANYDKNLNLRSLKILKTVADSVYQSQFFEISIIVKPTDQITQFKGMLLLSLEFVLDVLKNKGLIESFQISNTSFEGYLIAQIKLGSLLSKQDFFDQMSTEISSDFSMDNSESEYPAFNCFAVKINNLTTIEFHFGFFNEVGPFLNLF